MFDKLFERLFGLSDKRWQDSQPRMPAHHDESDEDIIHKYFGQDGASPPQFFFFRHFGTPGSHHQWPGGRDQFPDNENNGDDALTDDLFRRGFGNMPADPHDMFRHFEEMFRGFDDLFRGMGIAEFPRMLPPGDSLPNAGAETDKDSGSLRDRMLKQPDSHRGSGYYSDSGSSQPRRSVSPRRDPGGSMLDRLWVTPKWDQRTHEKLDQDLDAAAKSGKLEHILGPLQSFNPDLDQVQPYPTQPPGASPQPRSFNRVSVRTFRSADGKVEERRSVKDDKGNREDTVSRTLDGQTYTRVTHTDPSGSRSVKEDFNNMTEAERGQFERRWRGQVGDGPLQINPELEHHLHDKMASTQRETSGTMKNLFRFNFPGFNFTRKTDADR